MGPTSQPPSPEDGITRNLAFDEVSNIGAYSYGRRQSLYFGDLGVFSSSCCFGVMVVENHKTVDNDQVCDGWFNCGRSSYLFC